MVAGRAVAGKVVAGRVVAGRVAPHSASVIFRGLAYAGLRKGERRVCACAGERLVAAEGWRRGGERWWGGEEGEGAEEEGEESGE